jgi:hypothetical protein
MNTSDLITCATGDEPVMFHTYDYPIMWVASWNDVGKTEGLSHFRAQAMSTIFSSN